MPQIIVTLWPSTHNKTSLIQLYQNGVRLVRLNFTHETPEKATSIMKMIHQVEKEVGGKFEVIMDIEWPSIRTGVVTNPIRYKKWDFFKLVANKEKAIGTDIWCDYPDIVHDVKVGSIIKFESGLFDAIVREKNSEYIVLEALGEFVMISKRHINLPGIRTKLPTITKKDKHNIEFAQKSKFSYIAISFCRSAKDVHEVRKLLKKTKQIKIIAKIENQEGVKNIDEIIDASDMVMVARGDLGTELPLEKIPELQMEIVKKSKLKHTPVIVATQMLSSMVTSPAPTRAEVSDIFLATIEGADYLMLSEETTIGQHPIESVEIMNKIIAEANNGW